MQLEREEGCSKMPGRRGISRVQQVKEESSCRVQLSAAEQIREGYSRVQFLAAGQGGGGKQQGAVE